MINDYEKIIREFIKAIQTAQSENTFYFERVNELDKATQDLLHQIELGKPSERGKWATKLADVRKERRFAKDRASITEPIVVFADNNLPQIKAIERLLGDVRKENSKLKDRKYSPKVIKNLTINCKEC